MKHTINIGDEIAKLYGSGKTLTDNQGNWLWDRVLKDTPFPDSIRQVAGEYLEAYFQKFDSIPNLMYIEEETDKYTIVDNANSFVWTKNNKVAPLTTKLPALVVPSPTPKTHTVTKVKRVKRVPQTEQGTGHVPTKHEYRKEVRDTADSISVFNPIYFPYVFAFQHKFLWGLLVVSKILGIFALKVAKASLEVGWVAAYWSFKVMWMVVKYGMIVSVMTIPILCRIILVCFSFGLMGMPKKKKRRRR